MIFRKFLQGLVLASPLWAPLSVHAQPVTQSEVYNGATCFPVPIQAPNVIRAFHWINGSNGAVAFCQLTTPLGLRLSNLSYVVYSGRNNPAEAGGTVVFNARLCINDRFSPAPRCAAPRTNSGGGLFVNFVDFAGLPGDLPESASAAYLLLAFPEGSASSYIFELIPVWTR